MALDRDSAAVGRPPRRVELCAWFGDERLHLTGIRLQPHGDEIALAVAILHADQRGAVRRQIGIVDARLPRQLPRAAIGSRKLVKVAVDADVAPISS